MHYIKNSLWDWRRSFLSFKQLSFIACCFLHHSANVGVINKFWSSFKLSTISVAVDASLTKNAGFSSSSIRRFEGGLLPWLVLPFSFLKVLKIVANWLRLVSAFSSASASIGRKIIIYKYTKSRGNISCKESIRQLLKENYKHQSYNNVLSINTYIE